MAKRYKLKSIISEFRGKYSFLSNFYPLDNPIANIYRTSEHFYQAQKTLNKEEQNKIIFAPTPGAAKRLGKRVTLRKDWEKIKLDIMKKALKLKFQDRSLMKKLLDTKNAYLIECNNWHDNQFGNCTCSKCVNIEGKNYLGKLLMELRDELKSS